LVISNPRNNSGSTRDTKNRTAANDPETNATKLIIKEGEMGDIPRDLCRFLFGELIDIFRCEFMTEIQPFFEDMV
jgi:hypothetical protein